MVANQVDNDLLREAFPGATEFKQMSSSASHDFEVMSGPAEIDYRETSPALFIRRRVRIETLQLRLEPLASEPGILAVRHRDTVYFQLDEQRLAPFPHEFT